MRNTILVVTLVDEPAPILVPFKARDLSEALREAQRLSQLGLTFENSYYPGHRIRGISVRSV
jgi:hypothetical protein